MVFCLFQKYRWNTERITELSAPKRFSTSFPSGRDILSSGRLGMFNKPLRRMSDPGCGVNCFALVYLVLSHECMCDYNKDIPSIPINPG